MKQDWKETLAEKVGDVIDLVALFGAIYLVFWFIEHAAA